MNEIVAFEKVYLCLQKTSNTALKSQLVTTCQVLNGDVLQ